MRRVKATHYVGPMAIGCSKPQLFWADDGRKYVVKFRSNAQGLRVLPNELIAGSCAHALGLPVPSMALVNITNRLLNATAELHGFRATPGLQFGSEFVPRGHSEPWLAVLDQAGNLSELAGILVFDTWTNNRDRSWRASNIDVVKGAGGHYRVIIFDNGWVFGDAPNWSAESIKAERGLVRPPFMDGVVYNSFRPHISGVNPFDSWLQKLESLPRETIWRAIRRVPDGWGMNQKEQRALADYLLHRRKLVRPAIMGIKGKFPRWV